MFSPYLIPYTVPEFSPGSGLLVLKHALTGTLHKGEEIKKLEAQFAKYIGTKHAVAFASGRAGLMHAYAFYCKGKNVLLPSYTCIPAIDSARWAGCKLAFADIDLNSYNPILPSKLPSDLGGLSLSYLYGLVGDIQPFLDLAEEKDIPLIEDSAIALGGSYKGKKVGGIGNAGVFSLQASKITSGWRGCVVTTNDDDFYSYLLEKQAAATKASTMNVLFNTWFNAQRIHFAHPNVYGLTMHPLKQTMLSPLLRGLFKRIMNFNPQEAIDGVSPEHMPSNDSRTFTNVQAALARRSMDRIDSIVHKRQDLANRYQKGFEDSGVAFPTEHSPAVHAWGRFPIRIQGKNKFDLHTLFLKKGIETALNYPYLCSNTKWITEKQPAGTFPNAVLATRETILLPFHTFLRDKDVDYTVKTVLEALR